MLARTRQPGGTPRTRRNLTARVRQAGGWPAAGLASRSADDGRAGRPGVDCSGLAREPPPRRLAPEPSMTGVSRPFSRERGRLTDRTPGPQPRMSTRTGYRLSRQAGRRPTGRAWLRMPHLAGLRTGPARVSRQAGARLRWDRTGAGRASGRTGQAAISGTGRVAISGRTGRVAISGRTGRVVISGTGRVAISGTGQPAVSGSAGTMPVSDRPGQPRSAGRSVAQSMGRPSGHGDALDPLPPAEGSGPPWTGPATGDVPPPRWPVPDGDTEGEPW